MKDFIILNMSDRIEGRLKATSIGALKESPEFLKMTSASNNRLFVIIEMSACHTYDSGRR